MIERIHTLSYHHHQIGSMNFYPLFSVRSWNNGMCCMSLYILLMVSHTVWKRDNASFLLIKHILYLTLMCEQWKSAVGTWGKTTRTSIYTHVLTLLVLRLEYSGRTRTKPWLLIPWLLTSSCHQLTWYWLCGINRCWSLMGKDFNYLWQIIVQK